MPGEQCELPGEPEQPHPFDRIAAALGGTHAFQSLLLILIPLHGDFPFPSRHTNAGPARRVSGNAE